MGQQCLLKWSLPRGRISCASHNHIVSPFCFDHLVLALHYAYREACSPRHYEVVVLKECVALRRDYVLAEPRLTSCLLVIRGGHVGLSTLYKWQAGCTSLQIQSSQPCTLRVRTRRARPAVSSEKVFDIKSTYPSAQVIASESPR